MKYNILQCIGQGAFGTVYLAKNIESNDTVALKKIPFSLGTVQRYVSEDLSGPRNEHVKLFAGERLYREIRALQACKNQENIVQLLDVFAADGSVTLAFEYAPFDLKHVLSTWQSLQNPEPLPPRLVKTWFLQLMRGVRFLHDQSILHRDLKPANLLITDAGVLKIGDFGLARKAPSEPRAPTMTHQVATRWYRAPELLFGSRDYDAKVDIWACGCIFAEMWTLSPIFRGESDIEQIAVVSKALGSPTVNRWPGLEKLPDYNKIQFTDAFPKIEFQQLFPSIPSSACFILENTIAYDSSDRLSSSKILEVKYFYESPPILSNNQVKQLLSDLVT